MSEITHQVPVTKYEPRRFLRCDGCDLETEADDRVMDWTTLVSKPVKHYCPACVERFPKPEKA